jgi:anionic cell wall polymer biosynthesis LytR-Cps2A-Psr (LCP) family protein/uncharacterized protein YraI
LVELPPNTINIALLGIDKRPNRRFNNTDVIIIASINPDIPSVTMLSIPRDTLVYIPRRQVWKVNVAYSAGGIELFKETIRYNFGIKIDYYALVNFAALVHAVNMFGGIDVVATCPISHAFPRDPYYMGGPVVARDYTDTFTGEVWKAGTLVPLTKLDLPKPGVYTLDGLHTLAFVRARYGIPGGDVDRGRREQRVVRALFAKAKQIGTLSKIPELLQQFNNNVQTDLSIPQLLQLAGIADKFSDAVIRSRFLDTRGANGAVLMDAVQGNEYWKNRRDYIQQVLTVALNQRVNESIPVEVFNGTSEPGFAVAAADRLNEVGLRVLAIKAADKAYARTVIIDHTTTKKGNAVPLLLRTFNLRSENVVADPQPDGPRYTIIVGADFNTCYYANSLRSSGSDPISTAVEPDEVDVQLPESVDVTAPYATATPLPTATALPTPTLDPSQPTREPTAVAATATAFAQQSKQPVTVIVPPGDFVNVRSGPGVRFSILGGLSGNDVAPVLGKSSDSKWLQIHVAERVVWVAARVVQISGVLDAVPVVDATVSTAQATAAPTPIAVPTVAALVNFDASISVPRGDSVNVRRGSSTRHSVIFTLRGGQTANIIGRNSAGSWWQIRFNGRTGWVFASIVIAEGDTAAVPVAE